MKLVHVVSAGNHICIEFLVHAFELILTEIAYGIIVKPALIRGRPDQIDSPPLIT
jgi:hypothetical protein